MEQIIAPADLIGTWKLASVEMRYSDGDIRYPWGTHARGHLVYSSDGYMSAVIATDDRPLFATEDILAGSLEEQARAARSYVSYGGPYELHGNEVTYHVEVSLFPNWVGQAQLRYIEMVDDRQLILRSVPILANGKQGTSYLTWHKYAPGIDS
ncbi:lipocalin-like domain-containing protein [Dictyobacter aurantiacus]|uniref:Lipocalin-like domain-containing protein n=1 Tax=Dictyobacter aurantiacus TaxID=1936993 RepID=A0A401ZAL0_9CHLR|nr:lipocalin-like domain-containing protein [Dictyobacter aurantiacus]GCE03907.1 hypothetical protein KDAU_12360 [Dictyobacter aurantiacus]